MLGPEQVPTQIEYMLNCSVGGHESLGLDHRFAAPHPSLTGAELDTPQANRFPENSDAPLG